MPRYNLKPFLNDIKEYYVDEKHNLKETSERFGCGPDAMKLFLIKNNFYREGPKKTYLKAPKEEVYKYFVEENHSEKETAFFFKCSISALENYLKRNNIKKGRALTNLLSSEVKLFKKKLRKDILIKNLDLNKFKEEFESPLNTKKDILNLFNISENEYLTIKKYLGLKNKCVFSKETSNLLKKYSRSFIYNYYIEENHSLNECLNYFNIGRDSFLQCLNYYNIQKVTHLKDLINNIDEKEFKFFLKSNYSLNEISSKFKINYWQLISLIEYFKIDDKDILIKKGSIPENEFKQLLINNNLNNFIDQFQINEYKYDFKINNILIEINPTYSHNSTIGYRNLIKPIDKYYHFNKTKNALNNNYRCIHIWDWDDKNKIISILKNRIKIYARECNIKEVPLKEAKEYLNLYHLQGYARDSIRLGLYYKNKLVQIMTFGKPRYNKKYDYELIRLCSSYYVIGGEEKLFKYFISKYKPKSIISYCDNSKFRGDVYIKLNFNLISYGSPNKHWYNIENNIHITNNLLLQRGYDQLFKTNYGKGTSNEELMIQNGFVEIYDCGQSSYEWINPSIL